MNQARYIKIQGTVQGVGFRPFVYQIAEAHRIKGWVLNTPNGVEVHAEGETSDLELFLQALMTQAPPAAQISGLEVSPIYPQDFAEFTIRQSTSSNHPTTRISSDLSVCDDCLKELFDPSNRRYLYPYINCTNCGPRYSIITALPYDRPSTTMQPWAMCADCEREYHDPTNRRFHAQPIACPVCGPGYYLVEGHWRIALTSLAHSAKVEGQEATKRAVELLREGRIIAIKGIGGYHLACDARNVQAVQALRERKFRKEKPFALMVKDLATAQAVVELTQEAQMLLTSVARPIVLAPSKIELPHVASDNLDLGLMLPYTPLHHLLFAFGAPELLVMTSANRSSEPIAYRDEEALEELARIADAFLIGQRPIARRMDDSVVQQTVFGPSMVRRSRGYAPAVVATVPTKQPILAVGADLKNSIALAVEGQVFVSQHIGDLDHLAAFQAHQQTIGDLLEMYKVDPQQLTVVYDLHPEYRSGQHALLLPAKQHLAVQHHQAHIASVLAERGEYQTRVLGISLDGTGYGLDGAIWGGEFFVGSLSEGFERVAHLHPALLPGGDAAARWPIQVAAGFLHTLNHVPNLTAPPFNFPNRYAKAQELLSKNIQTFPTTSAGRLFDCVAALCGYTGEISFEGQAAIWLEHLARAAPGVEPYPMQVEGNTLNYHQLLLALIQDRQQGRDIGEVARAFHRGLAKGIADLAVGLAQMYRLETVVLSGGVFQNALLLGELNQALAPALGEVWVNREVPANDGGIGLGQIAMAVRQIR